MFQSAQRQVVKAQAMIHYSLLMQEASPSAGSDKDGGLRIAWQYRRYIQDKQKAAEASRSGETTSRQQMR